MSPGKATRPGLLFSDLFLGQQLCCETVVMATQGTEIEVCVGGGPLLGVVVMQWREREGPGLGRWLGWFFGDRKTTCDLSSEKKGPIWGGFLRIEKMSQGNYPRNRVLPDFR